MHLNEKYRLYAIIGLALHLFTLAVLFVTVWNNLSLHPETNAGPFIYFLMFAAVIFAIASFMLYFRHSGSPVPADKRQSPGQENARQERTSESEKKGFAAPYEVDIDAIAERIIPRTGRENSPEKFSEAILIKLAAEFEITQGLFYMKNEKTGKFEAKSTYAHTSQEEPAAFAPGEGLTGQAAKSKRILIMDDLPDDYLPVESGLGQHKANQLIIIPILLNKEAIGIIELSSFRKFGEEDEWVFRNLAKIIGNALISRIKLKDTKQ